MGRPPCCDKVGIKKGPWTPEEDIVLVSYIQEHGPGNWRAVPMNTGLMRCSKSCRLRWTNYLRPGIKRGNFTPHEEGMIIHLQALLGNKWAAIATYLPQRTDNDIKNYWNTHLKKKLKKIQAAAAALDHPQMASDPSTSNYHKFMYSKSAFTDQRGTPESSNKLSENSSVYASSAENISRLLEGWMRSSPLQANSATSNPNDAASLHCYRPQQVHDHDGTNGVPSHDDHELECFMSFRSHHHHHHHHHNLGNNYEKSSCDSSHKGSDESGGMMIDQAERAHFVHEDKPKVENNNPPLSYLEKWLLDESAAGCQVEGAMELPSIF